MKTIVAQARPISKSMNAPFTWSKLKLIGPDFPRSLDIDMPNEVLQRKPIKTLMNLMHIYTLEHLVEFWSYHAQPLSKEIIEKFKYYLELIYFDINELN